MMEAGINLLVDTYRDRVLSIMFRASRLSFAGPPPAFWPE
jgi:hypothetical protein